jgi:hypothetical protein
VFGQAVYKCNLTFPTGRRLYLCRRGIGDDFVIVLSSVSEKAFDILHEISISGNLGSAKFSRNISLGIDQMGVFIISFLNCSITRFGSQLEIAQRHIDDGDEVTILGCDGAIICCDANRLGGKDACANYQANCYAGLEILVEKLIFANEVHTFRKKFLGNRRRCSRT